MFDIGWSEFLVIGVVALIFIGPKELPTVLRTVGQWVTKIRRMASDFQSQFHEAMREAEMADLKKQVDDLGNTTASVTNFDPIGSVRREIESALEEKPKPAAVPSPAPAAEPVASASPVAEPSAAPATESPPSLSIPAEPASSKLFASTEDFAESEPAPKPEGSRA